MKNGELILAKGFGNATLEWKAPATPETVYLLASMTKQFTATAIMMLAAENRLKLDDPIASYVPGAPESWSSITLRHLLTHTAGLKDRFELMNGRMFMDYSTPQMLDAALRTPVDAPPGTKWQYSDQGYFLIGVVIEKASGLSYGQFLRDRVFGPLGMTSTSLEKLNGHREIYHAGSTGTCLYRLPDDGVSTIVLTNLEQVSGSDPCLIARAVAAQYVPEIAIVSVPPVTIPIRRDRSA